MLIKHELKHFKHSMAKAAKPWKPFQLPNLHRALEETRPEYEAALEFLSGLLELERSRALAAHAALPESLFGVAGDVVACGRGALVKSAVQASRSTSGGKDHDAQQSAAQPGRRELLDRKQASLASLIHVPILPIHVTTPIYPVYAYTSHRLLFCSTRRCGRRMRC